ncbi:MAG TPA: peptidoglycan recognition family protein [Drouetiella sp.]
MSLDLAKIKFDAAGAHHISSGVNAPTQIVMHAMVGYFEGTRSMFKNNTGNTSAHYLVSQKGEILQMVRDNQVANHCYGLNHTSIGIEMEDKTMCDRQPWVTPELWKSAVELVAALCKKYKIPVEKIYPHSEPFIQKIGGGKFAHHDPGKFFDMGKFRIDVAAKIKG